MHKLFKEWIAKKVWEDDWVWLSFLISLLCEIEMALPLVRNSKKYYKINSAGIVHVHPQGETESYAQRVIPKNTFYCDGCEFKRISKVALFFYGYQCCGYCYYLGKGDFSFFQPTDLLWDDCKECGINEDIEVEEEIPLYKGEKRENERINELREI